MEDKETKILLLKKCLIRELQNLKCLMQTIEYFKLENDQDVLNWLDELNKLSVKY